ncbi:MAG: hypothetical protein LBQ60_06385 [Bacteroidales bacterium]|jgi:hypothetical protein|nr:hypothetical protein [Bacteroidales bacterium]
MVNKKERPSVLIILFLWLLPEWNLWAPNYPDRENPEVFAINSADSWRQSGYLSGIFEKTYYPLIFTFTYEY